MVRPSWAKAQAADRAYHAVAGYREGGRRPYRLPVWLLRSLVRAMIAGEQRSFAEDAVAVCAGMDPSPVCTGAEHIPTSGPCLVVLS